ncbi:MAG: T9SS type A sorting domain-containing protein [Flavobacteriales bacterium]|nr:MAG: T9SS type A sorting domain-containing protein [Flavobacteriales bacterium]
MRSLPTFLCLFCMVFGASAALPPVAHAPLGRHMQEVNAQWPQMDPIGAADGTTARFGTEADRIRMHLQLVRERLAMRSGPALDPSQRAKRAMLLGRLGDYADARTFPRNESVAHRNPVFIDAYGNACAVGWLMIESGHGELAHRISETMNLAYVLEMPRSPLWPQVAAWADAHGFDAAELAWIQPAYPPNLPWQPLGDGTNGTVRVALPLSDGRLLIAGDFTEAGGMAASGVAIWDGSAHQALGGGVMGTVACAVEHEGALYVGGSGLSGAADLGKWNGTAWEFSTVFEGKAPRVTALHVHNGALHAAGTIVGFAGESDGVMRWEGGQWQPVGSLLNGAVTALASHAGRLVAAGEFTGFELDPVPMLRHVAELEGNEWSELVGGLDAPVHDLMSVEGVLYAAGALYANIAPVFGMARLAPGGAAWELLLPNLSGYIQPSIGPARINSMVEHEGAIYIAGSFVSYTFVTVGTGIARWSGIDQVEPLGIPEQPVLAVATYAGELVAGGEFSQWQPYITSVGLATGIADEPMQGMVTVTPNPAADRVRIGGVKGAATAAVLIMDASGRAVQAPLERFSDAVVVDASRLAGGAYLVRIGHPGASVLARFVRE